MIAGCWTHITNGPRKRGQPSVVLTRGSVTKVHRGSVEPINVGTNARVALTQVVENQGVNDGMRLVDLVFRLRKPEAHRVAGERLQNALINELFDLRGQRTALIEGVGRAAKQVARHEVVAAAYAHVDRARVVHGVDGAVAPAVACADDEHAFAGKLRC